MGFWEVWVGAGACWVDILCCRIGFARLSTGMWKMESCICTIISWTVCNCYNTIAKHYHCRIVSIGRDVGCSMLANEPTRSYIGPTRGRAQVYLRSTHVYRSSNHNTKSQKNLFVVIHPYDRTRPTNIPYRYCQSKLWLCQ